MSEKKRIPLARAQTLAVEIVELLAPACERIEIAGSIRREKPMVGDIEIVADPRLRYETMPDMFGGEGVTAVYSELDERCDRLLAEGRLAYRLNAKGHRIGWGEHNKYALYHPQDGSAPVPLDLFAVYPPDEQWGVAMVIRTGPADFNPVLISQRPNGALPWGWKVQVSDWTLRNTINQVVPTPDEADFFAAIGLPWIPPAERSVGRLRAEVRRVDRRASVAGALKT